MLRSVFCCCCGPAAAAYSAVAGVESGATTQLQRGGRRDHTKLRTSDEATTAEGSPFEIEIDDAEYEEEEAAFMAAQARGDEDGGVAGGRAEPLVQPASHESHVTSNSSTAHTHPRGSEIELHTHVRTQEAVSPVAASSHSRSPKTAVASRAVILQPPPSYQYTDSTLSPTAAAATAAATSVSPPSLSLIESGVAVVSAVNRNTLTRADLEVPEQDSDIVRFRRTVDQAEANRRKARAHTSEHTAATTTNGAPDSHGSEASTRPPNVLLPQTQPISIPSHSHTAAAAATAGSAHASTPGPAPGYVPKVVRKMPAAAVTHSVPNTPLDTSHMLPLIMHHARTNSSSSTAAPNEAALQATAELHAAQVAQKQMLALTHAPTLTHSPSAPPALNPASLAAFPTPRTTDSHMQPPPSMPTTTTNAIDSVPTPAAANAAPAAAPFSNGAAATAAAAVTKPSAAVAPPPAVVTKPATAAAAGSSLDRLAVPSGPISAAHTESIMSLLKQVDGDVSYAHLFAFLLAADRSMTAKVLRPFVLPDLQQIVESHVHANQKAGHLKRSASVVGTPASGGTAAAVPAKSGGLGVEAAKLLIHFLEWLVDVRVDRAARTLTLKLEFPGGPSTKHHYFDSPSQDTWVLNSRHTTDRFLLHPLNQPKIYRNDSHRLCLHRELQLTLSARGGIASIRAGDVSIKKFVTFNAELRTEYRPGMVEYDNAKNAFIQMDANDPTKPVIVKGRYVPRTFDYWLVVSVMKMENWIGLPTIGLSHPPNLDMKPHEGYPYP